LSRSVFLEEIPVAGLTLNDADFLKEKVYQRMDEELRKWRTYEAEPVTS
jgi:1-acyl-sn-glycerol-3-phosphate acyltransferase